ncbi:MAG: sulfotransferase [Deltaproteobacteria bacterium]|nr:sulfotransferase [Deltaproteobacteria bacterium]
MKSPENHKFIFIGGLHRSGTSLIHRCLREHPLISGFENSPSPEDEGQHLQTVYLAANYFGGPGRFAFYPDARLTEETSLVSEQNKLKLFNEWTKYWILEKPFLLEKSPPNIIRTRFLQALFPNSFFVIVTRHPVATCYSTMKWRPRQKFSAISLLKHWLVCHEIFDKDRQYLKNILVMKYEDFVTDYNNQLHRICNFLNIPTFQPSENILQQTNEEYFKIWEKKRYVFLRKYAILRFEKRMLKFGYSLLNVRCKEK